MKILLCSHAAWRRTGYGAPLEDLIALWRQMGHDAVVMAAEEAGPSILEWHGIRHYFPDQQSRYGEVLAGALFRREKCDLIVSLIDVWPLGMRGYSLAGEPWIPWFPIDQFPPQEGTVDRLSTCRRALVFSKWGAEVLKRAWPGRVLHMPYGINTTLFRPGESNMFNLPMDAFVVGVVGTNMHSDRKNMNGVMSGFALFNKKNPEVNAHLCLWTAPYGSTTHALDLANMTMALGLEGRVHFPQPLDYSYGGDAKTMAAFYRSIDVLLQPSAAEGWGIPIIEAQACGVPVVATDCSSMTELVPDGCGVLIKGVPEWSHLAGWWKRPSAVAVSDGLSEMYEIIKVKARPGEIRDACVENAKQYDWNRMGAAWSEALA